MADALVKIIGKTQIGLFHAPTSSPFLVLVHAIFEESPGVLRDCVVKRLRQILELVQSFRPGAELENMSKLSRIQGQHKCRGEYIWEEILSQVGEF